MPHLGENRPNLLHISKIFRIFALEIKLVLDFCRSISSSVPDIKHRN